MYSHNRCELISTAIDAPVNTFWKSAEIFLLNPQCTSKNVAGVMTVSILKFGKPLNAQKVECLADTADISAVLEGLRSQLDFQGELTLDELKGKFNHPEDDAKTYFWIVKYIYKYPKDRPSGHKCCIIGKTIYPGDYKYTKYFPLSDFASNSLSVLPLLSADSEESRPLPFHIEYSGDKLTISVDDPTKLSSGDKTIDWLKNVVAGKLQRWMQQELTTGTNSIKSLTLIDCEQYNELYNSLKRKYGTQMVSVWPEGTDPAKFVYEDVAIAAYLLMIWKQEREKSGSSELQSFVDLGCGNGLLVYLLRLEGHRGFGVDLRKRNIWDMYPKEVDLRVETIVPSDENLYPCADWIIGNHSDELSPWVPVIAARSSPKCRFFLLPCCAFEFNGQKFQRRNSKLSQYLDFMDFAKEISIACGYSPVVDRLKIPSTKRICIIGYDRMGMVKDFAECSRNISKFIDGRSSNPVSKLADSSTWSVDFKPRESQEAVKNCTKVKKSVVNEIIDLVFKAVVGAELYDPEVFDGTWNVGKGVSLNDLAALLAKEQLAELKSECGGLQTLLRNHHHIFEVRAGSVKLRVPVTMEEKKKQLEAQMAQKKMRRQITFQQKPCFFSLNHPNGCPLGSDSCSFKHGE